MNRRELFTLGAAGALGAGLSTCAHGHEHGKADGKPPASHGLHFCGIHVAKKDPTFQLVTQHYCGPLGDEMHQCLLYDKIGPGARLLGVEYIVSDRLYRGLPDEEKKYWHPHTYEVLGGGLIAPGMPADDEAAFMKALLTTWGKAWHTWPDPKTPVPMGEPLLIWSLTGDGQADPKVIAARDKEFGIDTAKVVARRTEAIGLDLPKVPQPKAMDTVGRQWTAEGEDKPTPRKK